MHLISYAQINVERISGICGIFLPIVFFTFTGLAISQSPWFSWTQHALSDLGVQGISAILFNTGTILTGVLAFMFSIGLILTISNKIGGYILLFSSFSLLAIGLFPISTGLLHFYVSATFFILCTIGFLVIGTTIKKNQFERKMGIFAIAFCCIAICSLPLLVIWDGLAISEILVLFPALIWCMIYGYNMLLTYRITNNPNTPAITG